MEEYQGEGSHAIREGKPWRSIEVSRVPSAEHSSTHSHEKSSKRGERTTEMEQVEQASETPQGWK